MIRNQSPPQSIQVTPADSDAVHGARSSLQVLTFVVVDLAESSSVLERLGEGREEAGRSPHRALLRNAIAGNRGRELHRREDRSLVVFDVPSDAVACAVAVQRATERHNKRGLDRLDIRIGIQFGEASEATAVSERGDYLARPAIEARQLCDAAAGGQILVSDIVSFIARPEASHTFERAGLLDIEGASSPWPTFEVVLQGVPSERPPLPVELAARPDGRCSFVGRDREQDELRRVWAAAADGERRLVFVTGEPGIGKSRLVAEFAVEAHADGAVVLSGRSFEESVIPYQPFVEALRQYVSDCDPIDLEAQIGGDPAALAALVPEVATPSLVTAPRVEAGDRYRLFDAVAAFLSTISISSPMVLVLDDLQWADQATLLLLKHLVMDPRPASILIVGTYRDGEVPTSHPLSLLQADLGRDHTIDRVHLIGLGVGDVAVMFEEMTGQAPPAAVAERLQADTKGNPFFVEEVISLLAEAGIATDRARLAQVNLVGGELGVPIRVRDFVARRMESLSPAAVDVLGVAAVVGTEFEIDVLADVVAADVNDLVDLLDEAVGSRLVVEAPGRTGTYAFAQALFQQTLHEAHSTNRRAALHARVAVAIESLRPDDPSTLSDLARHYALTAGRYAEKVVHYGALAGDRALAGLAYEDAIAEYSRALDALPLAASADELTRADLLVRLGTAQTRAGDEFKETFRLAAQHCVGDGSAAVLARAALGYGGSATFGGALDTFLHVDDILVGLLESALEVCPPDNAPTRIRLLGRLAQALYWSDDKDRMLTLSREALDTARSLGDPAALAYALDSRHVALWGPDHAAEVRSAAEEMLTIGRALSDRDIQLKAYAWLITDALETDPIEVVDGYLAEHERLSEELHQPYHLWYTEVTRGMRAHLDGRYDDMARLTQTAFALGQQPHGANAQPTFFLYTFMLNSELGRITDVIDTFAAYAKDSQLLAWRAALAFSYSMIGRQDEALEELAALAENDLAEIPRDCLWLATLVELSRVVARVGDVERAQTLYPLLLPYADRVCVVTGGFMCLGPVSRPLGLLAATIRDFESAIEHLEHALAGCHRLGSPPLIARAKTNLANVLLTRGSTGDVEIARDLLGAARRSASELGMAALVADVDVILSTIANDRDRGGGS